MHGGGFGGVWTTEIIICLVVDHGRTKEIIIDKCYYIQKNNKNYPRFIRPITLLVIFAASPLTKFDL